MNILILGSGGREYSIGLALKNEKSHNLYFMPGNGATSNLGKNINITDYEKLAIFAKENSIDLTIVGSDVPADVRCRYGRILAILPVRHAYVFRCILRLRNQNPEQPE